MQLPPREARGNLASVELPVEELSSTPGCSCPALGLWGWQDPGAQKAGLCSSMHGAHWHPAAWWCWLPQILLNQTSCPGWFGLAQLRGEAPAVPLVPFTSAADLARGRRKGTS